MKMRRPTESELLPSRYRSSVPEGKERFAQAAEGGLLKTKLITTCWGFSVAGALYRDRVYIKRPMEILQVSDLMTPK